ncbi:hypothetical protein [Paenibacillus ferrarius]|nr:hypothetical protein [Paenibacillus ferrarius]
MADNKYKINKGKYHTGKEFVNSNHFIGKIKPVKNKNESTDSWEDVPYFRLEEDGKKKVLEFILETALSNDIKVKLTGKEQPYAYPYSSKHKKADKVAWADRFDKSKYPDDTYHLIDPDWDKIDKLKEIVVTDGWVEVKGKYNPYEFENEQQQTIKGVSRQIGYLNPIIDGKVLVNGKLEVIKSQGKEITYVCDFESPDFVEVNTYNMQIGIKSTYQEEDKSTKVNGVFLSYGKERSEPRDVEMTVYYNETTDGSKPLADAFATLNPLDFIEVIGVDNNRATFAYVDVESSMEENDPFNDVGTDVGSTKKKRVVNGDKKGLEVTGFVKQSLMRGLLTEEEVTKSVSTQANDPFVTETSKETDPFATNEEFDPFA